MFDDPWRHTWDDPTVNVTLHRSRTAFYTPTVAATAKQVAADVRQLLERADDAIDEHLHRDEPPPRNIRAPHTPHVQLLVVDEAERLNPVALEHLRDHHDRRPLGLLLIGMPGIERRFAHYPQLYSRVGFAHHYQPLGADELQFVLTRHWRSFGHDLDIDDFTDAQAVALIARLTSGNFRLIERLLAQVARVLEINSLSVVTAEVIDVASSALVFGAS